jgi:hypothetical protein
VQAVIYLLPEEFGVPREVVSFVPERVPYLLEDCALFSITAGPGGRCTCTQPYSSIIVRKQRLWPICLDLGLQKIESGQHVIQSVPLTSLDQMGWES